MDSFACAYCETRQIVYRSGNTISLKLIGDAIARVQVGTDRTAAELAIRRLREDLAGVEADRKTLACNLSGGDTITGYLTILVGVSAVAASVSFFNAFWMAAFVFTGLAVVFAFRLSVNIRKCQKLRAQNHKAIEARTAEIQRQLARHHETVKA